MWTNWATRRKNWERGKASRDLQGFRSREETGVTRGSWFAVLRLAHSVRTIDLWLRLNLLLSKAALLLLFFYLH